MIATLLSGDMKELTGGRMLNRQRYYYNVEESQKAKGRVLYYLPILLLHII